MVLPRLSEFRKRLGTSFQRELGRRLEIFQQESDRLLDCDRSTRTGRLPVSQRGGGQGVVEAGRRKQWPLGVRQRIWRGRIPDRGNSGFRACSATWLADLRSWASHAPESLRLYLRKARVGLVPARFALRCPPEATPLKSPVLANPGVQTRAKRRKPALRPPHAGTKGLGRERGARSGNCGDPEAGGPRSLHCSPLCGHIERHREL